MCNKTKQLKQQKATEKWLVVDFSLPGTKVLGERKVQIPEKWGSNNIR